MAGSYKHCVDDEGKLFDPETLNGMLENGGDVYEAVEEMYGMIWYLASQLEETPGDGSMAVLVEEARHRYKEGVELSPTNHPALY